MDRINKFQNIVAPPFTFFSICILLPPTYFYKLFLSTLSSVFSESLSGKVVLITGASSGIGDVIISQHLTYEYARRGALLALIARRGRREDALQEVADQAREYGSPDVLIISADVSKVEDLDHLVNNAGIALACLFKDATDITDFKTVMDINFWGSIYTTRFALPHLRESRGKIIVLASSSWLPTPRMSFYNVYDVEASSVAIVSFFETLRVEVGPEIKVTIVALGFIESEMTQDLNARLTHQLKKDVGNKVLQFINMMKITKLLGYKILRRTNAITSSKEI